jgi:hypothetical protein
MQATYQLKLVTFPKKTFSNAIKMFHPVENNVPVFLVFELEPSYLKDTNTSYCNVGCSI